MYILHTYNNSVVIMLYYDAYDNTMHYTMIPYDSIAPSLSIYVYIYIYIYTCINMT